MARRLWDESDPIGRRLGDVSPSQTLKRDLVVTGVYDSRYFDNSGRALVFRSVSGLRSGEYLIQTAAPASNLADSVRRMVREELPSAPITSLLAM